MRRARNRAAESFVVCVRNDGYAASLEPRKIYRRIPDADGAAAGLVRVIDESGEDYLYPVEWFLSIRLQPDARTALRFTPARAPATPLARRGPETSRRSARR